MAAKPIQTVDPADQRARKKKKKGKKDKPEPKTWYGKLWANWIKPIGLAVLIVFGFRSVFYDWNDVPSGSMEPVILENDRILVNKIAWDLKVPFTTYLGSPWRILTWGGPERGDIVVFFRPQDGQRMVKRIVGLPGDVITLRDNIVTINGRTLELRPANQGKYERLDLEYQNDPRVTMEWAMEPLGDVLHPVQFIQRQAEKADFGPITVPEGHYFVMGDNRNNSRDSRYDIPGFIPRNLIVGKAFGVAFSYDTDPSFHIRWERFLRSFDQEALANPIPPAPESLAPEG